MSENVEWIENEKYEKFVYGEDEFEVFRYVYPLMKRGYYNYVAFGIYYNKGELTMTYFSDGWNGSGIHYRKNLKVGKLDVERIVKMRPKKAFDYLSSFFDDEENYQEEYQEE